MNLFDVILLDLPMQYILVFNILTNIILFFLVYAKFCFNMGSRLIHQIKQHKHFLKLLLDCFLTCSIFNVTCCMNMVKLTFKAVDFQSITFKAVLLVIIYITSSFQKKISTNTTKRHFLSGSCSHKSTKSLGVLLYFFFPITYLMYFLDITLLSSKLKHDKFILSLILSIFIYKNFSYADMKIGI